MQALVLLHVAGQPSAPVRHGSNPAGRAETASFADRQLEASGLTAGHLASPEPRAMAALPPLGVVPRTGPPGGHERTDPGRQRGPHPATAARYRLAIMTCGDFVARCASAVPILDGGAAAIRPRCPGSREIMRCCPAACRFRCSNWRLTGSSPWTTRATRAAALSVSGQTDRPTAESAP